VLAPVLRVLALVPLEAKHTHPRSVYVQCNARSTPKRAPWPLLTSGERRILDSWGDKRPVNLEHSGQSSLGSGRAAESQALDPLTRPAPAEKRRRRSTLSPKGERAGICKGGRG
jgi:hypothetical protein